MNDFLMWAGGIIVTCVAGFTGWVFKNIYKRIDDNKTTLSNRADKMEERINIIDDKIDTTAYMMVNEFAKRADVEKKFDDLKGDMGKRFDDQMDFLKRIDHKLDKKVDK